MIGFSDKTSTRRAAGCLMLVLWLATVLISISPEIHHFLHDDSQSFHHACLVTQVNKGQVLVIAFVAVLALLPLVVECSPGRDLVFVPSADFRLLPTRGPPAVSP